MKQKRPIAHLRILGEAARKTLPRTALGRWNPAARTHDPLQVLEQAMQGRVPALAPLKHERMACTPFSFFRGAVPIMAADLALAPHTGILCQLCGDAHVQNLGAYSGDDGRLIFDINDFDETLRGPFEWDVKRMATSILLAGLDAELKESSRIAAAEAFLGSYCELISAFARMPVLEVARFQVRRIASLAPISRILQAAERSTPTHSLKKLTEQTKTGRVFKSNPPLLTRITGAEAQAILASLQTYAHSLLPERRHFLAQFQPLDVAFKVVGTGSIGLRDYCVLLQGNGSNDPLFLQIKQEAPSAYAPYLPAAVQPNQNQGQRVAQGQRAMQLQSDPFLGWTTLDGRDFLVRQLNDHKASLDLAGLNASDLAEYAIVCGEMLARGHARSGDARTISGYLGRGARFAEAILTFARAYAIQTEIDWKAFVRQQKKH